ncbi:MAG: hypothetical protein GXN96_06360 [Aquificae bacterium]|nr:hypothetical protein [Aquificota bacterium]
MRALLAVLFLFLACAPKVCPPPEEVLSRVLKAPPPKVEVRGYVKAGFLRTPFLVKREGGEEEVKVGMGGLRISSEALCFGPACVELPASPLEVLYGYFPGKYRVEKCNGELVLVSEEGVKLWIREGKLVKAQVKDLQLLYGKRSREGYYEEVEVLYGDFKLKIKVEEVRWDS